MTAAAGSVRRARRLGARRPGPFSSAARRASALISLWASLSSAEPGAAAAPAERGAAARPRAPGAAPAPAIPAPRAASAGRAPLGIVVSGAVSLGVYEAGVLYYLTEALQAPDVPLSLRLATGASAGSANALFALLASCRAPVPEPQSSLFWRAWVPPGLDALFVPEDDSPRAALSRRSLSDTWREIERELSSGVRPGCDAVFGATATRVRPIPVAIAPAGLSLPRISERFAVRMTAPAAGGPPALRNYVDPGSVARPPLLETDLDGSVRPAALRDLLFASAAFPLAFAPQPVAHRLAGNGPGAVCSPATRHDEFVDGGLLDNQPLRLAVELAHAGLDPDGRFRAAPRPAAPIDPAHSGQQPVSLLYVTPDAHAYPEPAGAERSDADWLGLTTELARGVVQTARSRELLTLAETRPEALRSVATVESYHPKAGELFGAFFGFLERDFRELDFYLGMHDARRFLAARFPAFRGRLALEQRRMTPTGPWRDFRCVSQALAGTADRRAACSGERRRALRILLQVSLDRLVSRCAAEPLVEPGHRLCALARAGRPVPRLLPVPRGGVAALRPEPGEAEARYFLRLLGEYGFRFRDLGLEAADADLARERVRRKLLEIVSGFSERQPERSSLLDIAGRVAVDSFHDAPPRHLLFAVYGRALDAAYGYAAPGRFSLLRGLTGASLYGAAELLSSRPNLLGVAPFVGLELQPPGTSDSLVQWAFGGRVAQSFSSRADFGGRDCSAARAPCSGLALEAHGAMSLAQRIRLQVAAVWSDPRRPRAQRFWNIVPGIGLQWAIE